MQTYNDIQETPASDDAKPPDPQIETNTVSGTFFKALFYVGISSIILLAVYCLVTTK
ncbi:hypothetical protein [Cohnella abietis]|uniref:Uncharacterized protein n=1 Tax=Cohnella abietis TaxID=2507935 RepID=A0A3T1CZT3_9BACL|nr:hypothetical protein [Cohnella abietis]BBI31377.1 hypothetical protein KCTCHS21_07760 [Cohnella abietis]